MHFGLLELNQLKPPTIKLNLGTSYIPSLSFHTLKQIVLDLTQFYCIPLAVFSKAMFFSCPLFQPSRKKLYIYTHVYKHVSISIYSHDKFILTVNLIHVFST